jgi:hypothetical protein
MNSTEVLARADQQTELLGGLTCSYPKIGRTRKNEICNAERVRGVSLSAEKYNQIIAEMEDHYLAHMRDLHGPDYDRAKNTISELEKMLG